MKAIVIIAVIAALGFGGYKLYEKRKATKARLAFVSLVCDTEFMAQADSGLREFSALGRETSINGMLEAAQKSMTQAVALAQWSRTNVSADTVSALAKGASLEKSAVGQAIQEGYDGAKIRCPDKLEGISPGALGMTVGLLMAALSRG